MRVVHFSSSYSFDGQSLIRNGRESGNHLTAVESHRCNALDSLISGLLERVPVEEMKDSAMDAPAKYTNLMR